MLTQCPECKTAFRLHVNQLKAAAGKVRCSRCNTTFDALDNLFEAPAPEEEPATPAPELPTAPEPVAEKTITHTPEDEKRERVTSLFDEPDEAPGESDDDPLSHFIDELEESTTDSDAISLPPVGEAAQRDLPPDIAAALDALEEDSHSTAEAPIDEAAPQAPIQLPPVGETSAPDEEIVSAALDSIDGLFDVQAEELDETSEEIFEEVLSVEPIEEEDTLPLVEAEELDEAPVETFEEILSVEPIAEETLPLVEAEELDEAPAETFEEVLSVEPIAEETLPLVEAEELDETSEEIFEEVLSVEPIEEEDTLPLVEAEELDEAPEEVFEEVLSVEQVEEETLPLVEGEELDEAPEEVFEEVLSVEPVEEETLPLVEEEESPAEDIVSNDELDAFFEEATPEAEDETPAEAVVSSDELDAFFEEAAPEVEDETPADAIVSNDELDAFFEEAAPEAEDETPAEPIVSSDELNAFFEEAAPEAEDETPAEPIVSSDELDAFFEEEEPEELTPPEPAAAESIPEQGELLEVLEEEPDEESALDEILLPDEPEPEPVETVAPIPPMAAKPAADPLDPFSEEQLEHMLSPTEEQAAEEAATQVAPRAAPEVIELDSAPPAAEEPLAEDELVLSQAPAPSGYAIPTELTQARQGSGKGSLLWGLGIALMCGALVLQYLYYFRLQLVENPQLRPLLASMCEVSGCELPPRRDLGHIELSEHLMQFHPNYEQSLLITATLANRAEFDQPYPLVEVVMTDIEQQVVARRHFTPQQYMPKLTSDSFPANSEIPLMLEVVDPGNNAVGFEFRFY